MIWFLVSLISPPLNDPSGSDRLVLVTYETKQQCQKDLIDRLQERRKELDDKALVRWETCVPQSNAWSL